jgi:hypothetical protein
MSSLTSRNAGMEPPPIRSSCHCGPRCRRCCRWPEPTSPGSGARSRCRRRTACGHRRWCPDRRCPFGGGGATDDGVVVLATEQGVVVRVALDEVGAAVAGDVVVAGVAVQVVVLRIAVDHVTAGAASDRVHRRPTGEVIHAALAAQLVLAVVAEHPVAAAGLHGVVAGPAPEQVRGVEVAWSVSFLSVRGCSAGGSDRSGPGPAPGSGVTTFESRNVLWSPQMSLLPLPP